MKKIIFTVTNDLSQDQRMNRICTSLANGGFEVTLVGRKLRTSKLLQKKLFNQKRLFCFFTKGKLFYLEYNLRLFFYLLFRKTNIICAIDLDTILPAYIVSKIRRKKMVYDAHEYFTEMEEVVTRPVIKNAWETLEKCIIPKLKYAYTISDGYAEMFKQKYDKNFEVIRNITLLNNSELPVQELIASTDSYILYQGSVNIGRGLENLVEAMQYIDCKLYICGKGDILEKLKILAEKLNLGGKIIFFGFVDPEKLKEFTKNALLGITLFSNKGLSNHYSLANRFFDYLHSGIPQIAMNYPEYKKFNEKFEVALLINNLEKETIISSVNRLLNDKAYYQKLQKNCLEARNEYNWQNEEKKLLKFYQSIF